MADTLQIPILEDIGGWGFSTQSLVGKLKGWRGNRIEVPINSFGGSVLEGVTIYNILKGRSENVETQILGYAISMGSVIAQAGDERVMPENGFIMIHNPWSFAIGDANDMEHERELLEKMTAELASIYVSRTGLTASKIRKMMDDETWLTPREAREMGFVDRLTRKMDFQASLKPEQLDQFKNVPQSVIAGQGVQDSKITIPEKMKLLEVVNKVFGRKFETEEQAVAELESANYQAYIEEQVQEKVKAINEEAQRPLIDRLDALEASMDEANEKVEGLIGELKQKNDEMAQAIAEIKAGGVNVGADPGTPPVPPSDDKNNKAPVSATISNLRKRMGVVGQ